MCNYVIACGAYWIKLRGFSVLLFVVRTIPANSSLCVGKYFTLCRKKNAFVEENARLCIVWTRLCCKTHEIVHRVDDLVLTFPCSVPTQSPFSLHTLPPVGQFPARHRQERTIFSRVFTIFITLVYLCVKYKVSSLLMCFVV